MLLQDLPFSVNSQLMHRNLCNLTSTPTLAGETTSYVTNNFLAIKYSILKKKKKASSYLLFWQPGQYDPL